MAKHRQLFIMQTYKQFFILKMYMDPFSTFFVSSSVSTLFMLCFHLQQIDAIELTGHI